MQKHNVTNLIQDASFLWSNFDSDSKSYGLFIVNFITFQYNDW